MNKDLENLLKKTWKIAKPFLESMINKEMAVLALRYIHESDLTEDFCQWIETQIEKDKECVRKKQKDT